MKFVKEYVEYKKSEWLKIEKEFKVINCSEGCRVADMLEDFCESGILTVDETMGALSRLSYNGKRRGK